MKQRKNGVVRWLIKADGRVVDIEYSSEKQAKAKARDYYEQVSTQDEPFYPNMTVETELLEQNYNPKKKPDYTKHTGGDYPN